MIVAFPIDRRGKAYRSVDGSAVPITQVFVEPTSRQLDKHPLRVARREDH